MRNNVTSDEIKQARHMDLLIIFQDGWQVWAGALPKDIRELHKG